MLNSCKKKYTICSTIYIYSFVVFCFAVVISRVLSGVILSVHPSISGLLQKYWNNHKMVVTIQMILSITGWSINPLRAKFFRGNINIYLRFVSFIHIDMTQVLKIHYQVREGSTYSLYSQYYGCWCPGDVRSLNSTFHQNMYLTHNNHLFR